MEFRYEHAGHTTTVKVESDADGYIVTVAGRAYRLRAGAVRTSELDLELDGERRCLAWVAADGSSRWVALGAVEPSRQSFVLTVPDAGRHARHGQAEGHQALTAQMPGMVRRVLVVDGERVSRGQALVLLEAMKMEIRVTAPAAGVVRRVAVSEGQAVDRGQALVELVSLPDQPD